MLKSSTEVSLSDSFVLVVWGACPAIVNCKVRCFVRKMPCFMDKLSDGRRLSVKRGELWTKSLAGCESLQKKWLVFLRGWEV